MLEGGLVVPWHPGHWFRTKFLCVPLQLGQVVEWIGTVKLAGVDEAHEKIAHLCSVQSPIEESVLSMQDCLLQCSFTNVVI